MYYFKNGFLTLIFSVIPYSLWYTFDIYFSEQCDPKFGCTGTLQVLIFTLICWGLVCNFGHILNLFILSLFNKRQQLNIYITALLGVAYSFGHLFVFSYGADTTIILLALLGSIMLSFIASVISKI